MLSVRKSCLVAVLGLFLQSCVATETKPGFRTAVTSKGFQYLVSVGVPLLKKELYNIEIPDISGKADIKIGKVSYELKNIQLADLQIGSAALTSSPGKGLTFQATDISISVTGDWSYKSWLARDHGSISASGSSITLSVSILVGANEKGQPNVTTTDSSFNVDHLSVKIHGGASWLYNLFDGVIEDNIKKTLNDKMCGLASNAINNAANKALSSLPVVVQIDDVSELSYALIRQPVFSTDFVMTDHKGEFLSVAHPNDEVPFAPPPLPSEPPSLDRMVYLWATDYTANTAALVYMEAGYLRYNVTPDMVDSLGPFFKLDTSTFSLLIPKLYDMYPDKNMSIGLRSIHKPPLLSIMPEGINITVPAAVDFFVLDKNGPTLAFSLAIMASADANVSLSTDSKTNQLLVRANATALKAEMSILDTNVGDFDVKKVEGLFKILSNSVILPQINKFTNTGFPIPNVEELHFVNPSLTLGKGYVMIDTDVSYTV